MDAGFVSIVVAIIGGVSLILASLSGFRKENREDHSVVAYRLEHLSESVDKVSDKIDSHITDHAKGMM